MSLRGGVLASGSPHAQGAPSGSIPAAAVALIGAVNPGRGRREPNAYLNNPLLSRNARSELTSFAISFCMSSSEI
jgi:hypothetical protein